jgi:Secretion system C-terminal sorting domain
MRTSLILVCLMAAFAALAQPVDSVTIGNAQIKAVLHKDRPLIDALYGITDTGWVKLTEEIHYWASGLDFGGNLHLQGRSDTMELSKFSFGIKGIPQSAGFWRVTAEQWRAHRRDYLDNGIIDQPIPEIFSWPGFQNPFSLQYNGFAVDDLALRVICPEFFDADHDGIYRPDLGDVPSLSEQYGFYNPVACEAVYAPIYWTATPSAFNHQPVVDYGKMFIYHFQCCAVDFNTHSLHLEIKALQDLTDDPLLIDSLQAGLFINSDLGQKGTERLGTAKGGHAYFYQNDAAGAMQSGVFSCMARFGHVYEDYDLEYQAKTMGCFVNDNGNVSAAQVLNIEKIPATFYNLMTNHWNDNTPLQAFQSGYVPGLAAPLSLAAYDGNPTTQIGWLDTLSAPVDRAVIQSNKRTQVSPFFNGAIENYYAFTWANTGNPAEDYRLISDQYPADRNLLFTTADWLDVSKPYIALHDWDLCDYTKKPAITTEILAYPNPTNGRTLFLDLPEPTLKGVDIEIYNSNGQLILRDFISAIGSTARVNIKTPLSDGLYFVKVTSNEKVLSTKFLVTPE